MSNQQGDTTKEAWILCLIFGIILINFPFIQIFNNNRMIFGIPTLVLYFFLGWPASIFVIWLFVKQENKNKQHPDDDETE